MPPDDLRITAVTPSIGVEGGEITIVCRGFKPGMPSAAKVLLGESAATIVSASAERVVAKLPQATKAIGLCLQSEATRSVCFPFILATRLATSLHPVTSPAPAPDGTLITTISGSRGQQVAQPLVRVTCAGEVVPFACTLMNPTGVAFGPDGQLYVSSRNDGVVYRYTDFEQLESVAEDLGTACGIAFNSRGEMYVGDRAGRILCIDRSFKKKEFAAIEASVSAFHLAVDSNDWLYVTGPTLSMRDPLYRISPEGKVEAWLRGFARPQGLAIQRDGSILLAASYMGKKGVFRISPAGKIEHYIASPTLVGVAVSGDAIFLVDSSSVYLVRACQ